MVLCLERLINLFLARKRLTGQMNGLSALPYVVMTCVWQSTNPLLRFSGLLLLWSFVLTAIVVAAANSICCCWFDLLLLWLFCCCWLDCVGTLVFVFRRYSWISHRHQMDPFAALGAAALARLLIFREATASRRQAIVLATFSTLAWSLIRFEGRVSIVALSCVLLMVLCCAHVLRRT